MTLLGIAACVGNSARGAVRRTRPLARLSAVAGRSIALGLLAGAIIAVGGPVVLGGQSFSVMSGSMAPSLETGDVVAETQIAPRHARAGDIVTFPSPDKDEQLITHRVRSVERRGGRVAFVTKGDANTGAEEWSVAAGGHIGRVAYRVPKLGYALVWARTPTGSVVLVMIPAVLLGAYALVRIWRPRLTESPSYAGASAGSDG